MEIFVSELPKDCSECPMCRSGNLKLQRNGRYVEAEQCVFGQYKYQTIDDEIDTCPLKPLSDRLAEEFEALKETFVWGRDNGYLTPKSAVGIVENKIKDLRGKNE